MSKRVPPRLSVPYLESAALHYLERFASSSANLRRVLMRKAARAQAHWGGEAAEAAAMVETAMVRLAGLGYLDDGAFAQARAASLHRRGQASRAIRAGLAARGVAPDLVDAALSDLAAREGRADTDLDAALILVRRRRLGPYRPEAERAARRLRDLAVLARAGFSHDVARRVIDADRASLEEWADGATPE